jgi:alpha-mannosidase
VFRRIVGIILALAFAQGLPAGQKRVYIANDDHTDYMWKTGESGYRQAFLDMLDYYLDLADQTAGKSADYRSRFNPDGSFWVRVYEQNRTTAKFNRLIGRIKDGSISVPVTLLNLCYGAMPAEAVLRSMYYAGQLERNYGLDLKLALSQENQTLPFGVGTLFAGAGASYFWKGICGCASKVPDAWDRPHDMYWWTGLDGSRILTKWNSQTTHNYYGIGGYAEARDPSGAIDFVLSSTDFQTRHPYDVIGLFGYGGDDLKTTTDLFVKTAQSKTTSDHKVIVSNINDFFEDFAASYGSSLPSQSVSFGNEWDILSASMSGLSARVKRATEKLRAAEAMAAYVSLRNSSFMSSREDAREAAWVDLGMYYDHDWTADGPITRAQRAAWERDCAAGIESYVSTLLSDARTVLGGMIANGGTNPRYFVFNPLGWVRTGAADLSYSGTNDVHVIDTVTGLEAPSQKVTISGQRYLRIWAENIPPVGYKTFDVVAGSGAAFGNGPTTGANILENASYRLQVGTNGAIVSLIDKLRGNREMVRTSGGRTMNDLGTGNGTIAVENAGPVSATLRITSSGPLVHETAVTLYRSSSRIEIQNEIKQNFGDLQTWDFNVNLELPALRHEEIGAVLLARMAADGGQYSPKAARYDWLSLNHFADLSAGGTGLTISSPDLSFFRRGSSTAAYLDIQSSRVSILAGGQVDGTALGIPNQGGDTYFLQRFALETHGDFDAAEAMRFSLEHQNPLETGEVTGGTAYPADSFSLFSCTSPGVFVWAVKPAEDTAAGGIVVRLWNQTSAETNFGLQFDGFTVVDAKRTSLIETPLESSVFQSGLVSGTIPGFGWRAYHLKLKGDAIPVAFALTSPNGGESWFNGSTHNITWTTYGAMANVKLEYSTDDGTSWTTIIASTPNANSYAWTVPLVISASCRVRISEASTGNPADSSDDVFSIIELPNLALTSPNGGETWASGSAQSLTWISDATIANVKLEYSTDGGTAWTTIIASTPAALTEDGADGAEVGMPASNSYAWTVPAVSSTNCLVRISEALIGTPSDTSDAVFTINTDKPIIGLTRKSLNFAKVKGGPLTPPEKAALTNLGLGTMAWKTSKSVQWISVLPMSGMGNKTLNIKMVNVLSLGPGTYAGTVTVTDASALNSPQNITVNLVVKAAGTDAVPFGAFDTPANGATINTAMVAVSGWALDDVGMKSAKIYRQVSATKKALIGTAKFIAGARPDIETTYPTYPQNNKAGWSYTLAMKKLPGKGVGTFVLMAYVQDLAGHLVLLGTHTITGVAPTGSAATSFGDLDLPEDGGTASGSKYPITGWALTPPPNAIAADGSGLTAWVDGLAVGHPSYGIPREDVAAEYPGYTNSDRAAGSFRLDTTKYADGWHTLAWSAMDSAGMTGEIGSRYFRILNRVETADMDNVEVDVEDASPIVGNAQLAGRPLSDIVSIPENGMTPIFVKRGFRDEQAAETIYPETDGSIRIQIPQVSRLAIYLNQDQSFENEAERTARAERILSATRTNIITGDGFKDPSPFLPYKAYALVGEELRALPIGASFDARDGFLFWQPGPGFLGEHQFVLVDTATKIRRTIRIMIK